MTDINVYAYTKFNSIYFMKKTCTKVLTNLYVPWTTSKTYITVLALKLIYTMTMIMLMMVIYMI